jgi:hypothetical protein
MALETVKSTFITNRDASPVVGTLAAICGGILRTASGNVVVSANASIASYYPMFSVPSNSRIASLKLRCAALGAGCLADVSAFVPTVAPASLLALNSNFTAAAVIVSQFFASAVDVSAALGETDVLNESGNNTIAKQEQELWQALGLASDPNCMIDIAVKLTAAAVAGGALQLTGTFVQ